MQLKPRQVQKMRLSSEMVMLTAGSLLLISGLIKIFIVGSIFKPETATADPINSPSLSFKSSTLISGTAGDVNAVYLFPNVTTGVDARVTLLTKLSGVTLSNIDQLGSSTGYDDAFQPIVGIAAGSAGTPVTSYIEWKIEFKKAGTTVDTIFKSISATAMDVDGGATLREMVQAFTSDSYSTDPVSGTELSVTKDSTSVTAVASTNNYTGIDSLNKTVMFQMNFSNVSSITYRTGGINTSSATSRNTSIYFKPFFSNFTPLPVMLISFTAEVGNNASVILNWATAAEVNNDYFTIERSQNGTQFSELTKVEGAGNSTDIHKYSFSDDQPLGGISYYRLKQTDFNGKSETFKTVSVNIKTKQSTVSTIRISPNPFNDSFTAQFESLEKEEAQFQLLSVNGAIIFNDKIMVEEGKNSFRFTAPSNLKPGTYVLRIINSTSVLGHTKVICSKDS